MSKNRSKQDSRRAQKSKARSASREKVRIKEAAFLRKKSAHSLVTFQTNPQTGYEYWFAHGANFLLSSYSEGLWTPLYPEVYEGKTLTRSEFFRRLIDRHYDSTSRKLSPEGTRTVIWCSLKPKEMFALVGRARGFSWKADLDPRTPANPQVWSFLDSVMKEFSARLDEAEKTDSGSIRVDPDAYGRVLPEAVARTIAAISGVPDPSLSTQEKSI